MLLSTKRFLDQAKTQDKPFFAYLATSLNHGPRVAYAYDPTNLNCNTKLDSQDKRYLIYEWNIMIAKLKARREDSECEPDWYCEDRQTQSVLLDMFIERLFSTMKEANVDLENTLFIFTADHGSVAKGSTYELGVRVPLLIHWPAQILPNQVVSAVTTHLDLLPTILQAATGSLDWWKNKPASGTHGRYPDDTGLSLMPTMLQTNMFFNKRGANTDLFQKRHLYFEAYLDRALLDPATGQKMHLRDNYCQPCEETCSNDLRTRWSSSDLYENWNSTLQVYNIFQDPAETRPSTSVDDLSVWMKKNYEIITGTSLTALK